MRINVIFGSKSDSRVYELLRDLLERIPGVEVNLDVCSAHREPIRLLKKIEDEPCDLYICGAGLAAHLPGVVASHTAKQVIGIPCNDVLSGTDALLSIVQMPKGIPVLSSGVENVESVARFVEFFAKQKDNLPSLRIIAPKWAEAQVEELAKPLEDASWKVERDNYSKVGEKVGDRNILHIVFADLNSPIAFGSAANILSEASLPWLALPLTNEKPFRGELNILFDFINKGGLWVGVNTTQNMLLSLLKLWPAGIKSKALEEVAGKK